MMTLTFSIENESSLPDGGPINFTISGKRGFDIGRDSHLDWTLPDPDLIISGKHCEVRFHDEGYWLHDLSRNGTFLNDETTRMLEPHRLRDGDRLSIGRYLISVKITGDVGEVGGRVAQPSGSLPPNEWWSTDSDSPPPIDPRELKPAGKAAVTADFLDWSMQSQGFVHTPETPAQQRGAWDDDADWIKPPPPLASPPITPLQSPPVIAPINAGAPEPWPPAFDERLPESAPSAPAAFSDDIYSRAPHAAGTSEFMRKFAEGAGIPEAALASHDPDELAFLLGQLMQNIVGDTMQLLRARYEAKKMARTGDQTMIQATDNNPLKFSPSSQEALSLMFGPSTSRYLNAPAAFRQAFDDLKRHQINTLAAMQGAVKMLVEDLDPKNIDADVPPDGKLAMMIGSRKARLWEVYSARWNAKAQLHEDGLLGAFMFYFPQCYDRGKAD
jgi:type VI secretion system protein ImpI